MILRYDQGMTTPNENPRPMPGRGPKPLTAEELLALPAYVLKRFEDLARTNDQAEIKEVFEDFIAFAPDLARVATDLTAQLDSERFAHANTAVKVKNVEALADDMDHDADLLDQTDDLRLHLIAATHREDATRLRAALNGGDQ